MRIALRLPGIRLGLSTPIDAAKGMAAASLYNSVAILTCAEARPKPNMKRNISRKWCGILLEETTIYDCQKIE